MKRLLLDQGIPRSAVMRLAQRGLDVVHVGDVGLSRASDEEILVRAAKEDRVVVTLDADFHTILALSKAARPSVIRVRIEGLNGEALSELLMNGLLHVSEALDAGALVSVTESRIRVHRLPILRD